jgi:hypothetical protein
VHRGFWWGDLRKRGHLKDIDVDGKIILHKIYLKDVGWRGMYWVNVA